MDAIKYIFAFDAEHPLLFTRFYFWVFLAFVYTIFSFIVSAKHQGTKRMHARNVWLMCVSWFFYYKTSGIFLLLLIALTISNWLLGKAIHACRRRWVAALWLTLAVLTDLSALFYYKYAYFGVDVFNTLFGTAYTIVDQIILPVGISFYTFQVISYVVDVFRKHVEPVANLLDFGFYVSFFPQLVAGPIVRASEFVPQLYKPYHLSRRLFGIAVFWILNGLLKKIILSDYLAVNFIDRVFDNPLLFTGPENLFALFAYSLQVYADFSGYTDIAIGVAMLFGFYLPKNFDSPYKSRNPQEFWRRWHQSLSRWLKSYVYIPLGGNRTLFGKKTNKILASNVNSMTTMLIGGLWHGASWNFVIWGALNGIGMVVNKVWREWNGHGKFFSLTLLTLALLVIRQFYPLPVWNLFAVWAMLVWGVSVLRYLWWLWTNRDMSPWLQTAWAILQTFTFVTFTRLFFRASSNLDPATANRVAWETATNMVEQIGGAWDNTIILPFVTEYWKIVALFAAGMLIHWLPSRLKRRYRIIFASLPVWLICLAIIGAVALAYTFVTADMQPFIYFQF